MATNRVTGAGIAHDAKGNVTAYSGVALGGDLVTLSAAQGTVEEGGSRSPVFLSNLRTGGSSSRSSGSGRGLVVGRSAGYVLNNRLVRDGLTWPGAIGASTPDRGISRQPTR